eukprot:1358206-Prymnesium_polylepis.1
MTVGFKTAGFAIGWWLLDWLPNEAVVLPARLLLSAAYAHEAFLIGTAYSGLLWCALAGAAAHVAFGLAWDTLGTALISNGLERQRWDNPFLQPPPAKKEKEAKKVPASKAPAKNAPVKKAPKKPDKYLYRLARWSEPALDKNWQPQRDGGTVGRELMLNGSGDRFSRSMTAAYHGHPDVDGEGYFLHVWTTAQVREAAARLFAGDDDLVLLKFSRAWLLESEVEIRYEECDAAAVLAQDDKSRLDVAPGEYPHVYAGKCREPELSYLCLIDYYRLSLSPAGKHIFPREAFADDREQDWDDDPM